MTELKDIIANIKKTFPEDADIFFNILYHIEQLINEYSKGTISGLP